MKKKVVISLLIAIFLAILLVPIPTGIVKDGGTRTYTAITYKVVKWHKLLNEDSEERFYINTSVYLFPDNFKSLDELWDKECKK